MDRGDAGRGDDTALALALRASRRGLLRGAPNHTPEEGKPNTERTLLALSLDAPLVQDSSSAINPTPEEVP